MQLLLTNLSFLGEIITDITEFNWIEWGAFWHRRSETSQFGMFIACICHQAGYFTSLNLVLRMATIFFISTLQVSSELRTLKNTNFKHFFVVPLFMWTRPSKWAASHAREARVQLIVLMIFPFLFLLFIFVYPPDHSFYINFLKMLYVFHVCMFVRSFSSRVPSLRVGIQSPLKAKCSSDVIVQSKKPECWSFLPARKAGVPNTRLWNENLAIFALLLSEHLSVLSDPRGVPVICILFLEITSCATAQGPALGARFETLKASVATRSSCFSSLFIKE